MLSFCRTYIIHHLTIALEVVHALFDGPSASPQKVSLISKHRSSLRPQLVSPTPTRTVSYKNYHTSLTPCLVSYKISFNRQRVVLSPNLTGLGNFPLFTPAHQLLLPMLVRANTSSIRRSRSAVAGLSTSLFIGGFSKTSICSVMTRAWGGVNHKKRKQLGELFLEQSFRVANVASVGTARTLSLADPKPACS